MKLRIAVLVVVVFVLGIAAGSLLGKRIDTIPGIAEHEHEAPAAMAEAEDENTTWYTCGMHPEVVQDHPGDCPKCGMKLHPLPPDRAAAMGLTTEGSGDEPEDRKIVYWRSPMVPGEIHPEPGTDSMGHDLVPVYADEVGAATIRVDPVTEQNMGIRTAEVATGPVRRTVRTVGFIEYDEGSLATVTTKVDGWIEKLHVDETGAQVHAGDPLFDLYSPQLFSAQEEYLAALRNRDRGEVAAVPRARLDSAALVRDARTRLEYFDVPSEQIAQLERTGRVKKTVTIRAPFTGIVTHKNVVEGDKITAGADLFKIADLSTVWVIGKVFENDLPYVEVGQEALMSLSYIPGKTFRGHVTYVYPFLDEETRAVALRMEFHNPGYELKPGMYTTVSLSAEIAANSTLVPDVAVIRTGVRNVAFVVTEPGRFELRQLRVGVRAENDRLQVLSGLAPGETVVVSGQFLLDSESRLREAALKFTEPGPATEETLTRGPVAAPDVDSAEETGRLFHVCPMPEHVDVLYDEPGDCPLCGMKMVPVRQRSGEVENPSPAFWTCPMEEHAHVREPNPGQCPFCGMTLVRVQPDDDSAAATEASDEHSH